MKRYHSTACILIILLFSISCKRNVLKGEGNKTTSAPAVVSFNAIDINLPLKATINLQEGAQPGIQLIGYENIIKHIRTKVDNNTLHLETDLDEMWTIDNKDLTIVITVPFLTSLTLSGSTDADIHGNITGKSFQLNISGASDVVIDNINTDNFSADVSGACDLTIKGGAVKQATYGISGAGTIKAFPLQAAATKATISGAGTTQVTALQQLNANVNGAGTIKYKGHPNVSKQVSGVGTISEAN